MRYRENEACLLVCNYQSLESSGIVAGKRIKNGLLMIAGLTDSALAANCVFLRLFFWYPIIVYINGRYH
jgi:hypothetical protein